MAGVIVIIPKQFQSGIQISAKFIGLDWIQP